MSYLDDILGKSRDFLSSRAPRAGAHRDAVITDTLDRRTYRQVLEEIPAVKAAVADLNVHYSFTGDLLADTYAEFYKAVPKVRPEMDMRPDHFQNLHVATKLADDPETPRTRGYTQHDKYGATMATLGVVEKLREWLREHAEEQEKAEQAQSEQDAADAAAGALEDLSEQLAAAMAAAVAAMGGYQGEGPLTEAQAEAEGAAQALGQQVGQALQDAQSAQQQADNTCGEALAGMAKGLGELRDKVTAAVKEAGDELADEAMTFFAWGLEDGQIEMMNFEERRQLYLALKNNRLNDFIKLLGRFRMFERADRAKRVVEGRDEVVGVELSDDLERVIESELARSRSHKMLRLDFFARYAEGQLLSREFVGEETVGDGAIIAVIDSSDSMKKRDVGGASREAWSKAFALALLDRARFGKRDMVVILFSSPQQQSVYRFPKGVNDLPVLLEMTEKFFRGGTHYEKPLDMAVEILERQYNTLGQQRGDIILMTDDECAVNERWLEEWHKTKERLDFRAYGLQIGNESFRRRTLHNLCDGRVTNIRELADPEQVGHILRGL